jgi:AcrR family transcriptional regulator
MKLDDAHGANMTRSEAKEATQFAILNAGSERFFSLGYAGTSLSDVARDAGVKVPLLVYHFQNKETLWKACVNQLFAKLDGYLSALFESVASLQGREYLRTVLTGYIEATAKAPEYMRLIFLEGMQSSERLRWLVDTHQRHHSDMIMNIIEQAQQAGSFKKVDLMHAKYILSSAVAAPFILAPEFELMTGAKASEKSVIDKHVDTCLALLFTV